MTKKAKTPKSKKEKKKKEKKSTSKKKKKKKKKESSSSSASSDSEEEAEKEAPKSASGLDMMHSLTETGDGNKVLSPKKSDLLSPKELKKAAKAWGKQYGNLRGYTPSPKTLSGWFKKNSDVHDGFSLDEGDGKKSPKGSPKLSPKKPPKHSSSPRHSPKRGRSRGRSADRD